MAWFTKEEIAQAIVDNLGDCLSHTGGPISCADCPILHNCTSNFEDRVTSARAWLADNKYGTTSSSSSEWITCGERKCNCELSLLMRDGCKCGGK